MKKMMRVILSVLLTFGGITAATPAIAETNLGCDTDFYAAIFPSDCVIEYQDQARLVGSYKLNPYFNSCNNRFAGLVLNTGYEDISYIRIKGLSRDGHLTPGAIYPYEVVIDQPCHAWANAYTVGIQLSGPDGKSTLGTATGNDFKYHEKFTGPLDSYCFTQICGTGYYYGTLAIPLNAIGGDYRLSLTLESNKASEFIALSPITASASYSHNLAITPESTGIHAIASGVVASQSSNGEIVCYVIDFRADAVVDFKITGTHWQVSDSTSATVLDEYDWGLGLNSDGSMKREFTSNGAKISNKLTDGTTYYGYGIRNQVKGHTYSCTVSVTGQDGLGRPTTVSIIAPVSTSNFTAVATPAKKTIVCVSVKTPKVTRKVTAVTPSCPKGFKKK